MTRLLCITTNLLLATVGATVNAAPPTPPVHLGLCAACHGHDGVAVVAGTPNLAGQRLDYLRDALAQYRDGRRKVTVMRAAVGPLSAQELDQLARWYAAQAPASAAVPSPVSKRP